MHIIMLTAQYCIDYVILCANVDILIARLHRSQSAFPTTYCMNRFVSVKVFSIRRLSYTC